MNSTCGEGGEGGGGGGREAGSSQRQCQGMHPHTIREAVRAAAR